MTVTSERLAAANQRLATLRALNRRPESQRIQPLAERDRVRPKTAAVSGHLAALVERLNTPASLVEPVKQEKGRGDATIPVYTSIATAITRNKMTAAGRVWLIVHHYFNRQGRQLVSEAEIVDLLCGDERPYRLFGRRQWFNIRRLGSGIFWEQANQQGSLLIHGMRRVSLALNETRIEKGRVHMPLALLTKSVKSAKSALYATFDASRSAAPVSRAAKQRVSGLDRVSQWRHEKQSGLIHTVRNYEVVCQLSEHQRVEDAAFTYGNATFAFTDWQGKQGKPGQRYLTRQMPNSYSAPALDRACDGRRKKLNRQLRIHVNNRGMVSRAAAFERRYYDAYQAATLGCTSKQATMRIGGMTNDVCVAFWTDYRSATAAR